ncbi:MAG TPA: heme exporter protein CcmD [Brevundimonas sp.]|jgi:heme exporter protein CcmD|nr:heme exporter protein CcmD [Brevundimonas sp.]
MDQIPRSYVEYVAAAWGLSALVLAVVAGRALLTARRVRARLQELEDGK